MNNYPLNLHTYGALWQGHELKVKASTTYEAQQIAVIEFQKVAGRRKVKGYEITIMLMQLNGRDVVHVATN
jgi:hypothetical protein